jgi:hypothetical protein
MLVAGQPATGDADAVRLAGRVGEAGRVDGTSARERWIVPNCRATESDQWHGNVGTAAGRVYNGKT